MKSFVAVILILLGPTLHAQTSVCIQESNELETEVRLNLESVQLALANASWTHDDQFEGQVAILKINGNVGEGEFGDVDSFGFTTRYYLAQIETELQAGESGLEHAYIHLRSISFEKVKELERDGKLHIVETGVSLANAQLSRDLPLAQELYLEAEPVRVYATLGWSPHQNSDWEVLLRASASIGYAHAQSTKDDVANTNNFYVGQNYGVSVRHRRFGQIDFSRGVDGELQKYNSESRASREADVSLGYTYFLSDRSSITVTGEKRSFRFGPDYEKSRRYMISFERKFR